MPAGVERAAAAAIPAPAGRRAAASPHGPRQAFVRSSTTACGQPFRPVGRTWQHGGVTRGNRTTRSSPPCPTPPTRCSTGSTPSSARSPRPCTARCACWPAPARARPGRSPTGSPTGCAPAILQPASVLAVTFTARAAGEMRGAAARSSARAGSRRARSTRRRCASSSTSGRARSAARCRGCWSARSSSSPRPARAAGSGWTATSCGTSPARSSGAKVTQTVPEDYPAAAAKTGREVPRDPAEIGPRLHDVRAAQAGPRGHRLRGRAAADGRRPPGPARRRRHGPLAVPALRRRRVPGRQPAPAAAARPVARRPGRPVRGRRRQPDHLLLHRRHPRLPARLPRPPPATPPSSSWSATTAPPRRSSTWRTALLAQAAGPAAEHRLELVSQREPGPEPASPSTPTSPPRPRAPPAGSAS